VTDARPMPSRQWRASLRTLSQLRWRDRWLLAQALVLIPCLGLLLKAVTFQRLARVLGALSSARVDRSVSAAPEARTVADVVGMASRHTLIANTCLHRSLALWWLLRRRGFDCQLRFGARKSGGRFEAHAWVEHEGTAIGVDRSTSDDFAPIAWFPARTSI